MINIHPALLPSFKGLDTHRRALDAGVRIHGCTVHFVTPEMDDGPIIAQAAVPVLVGDDRGDARRPRAQGRAPALSAGAEAGRRRQGADGERAARSFPDFTRREGNGLARLFSPAPGARRSISKHWHGSRRRFRHLLVRRRSSAGLIMVAILATMHQTESNQCPTWKKSALRFRRNCSKRSRGRSDRRIRIGERSHPRGAA